MASTTGSIPSNDSQDEKQISPHSKPHLRISVPDDFESQQDEHEIKECNLYHELSSRRSIYSGATEQTHSTVISKDSNNDSSLAHIPYSPLNREQAKRHSIRSFDAVKIIQCANKNKKSNCGKGRTSKHSKSNQSNSQNRRQYNSGGNGDNNNNGCRRNNNGCNGNGNKRNGDDEKKRENDKIIDEEDDDDEDDTEDEENDEMDENDDDEKHDALPPNIYQSKSCETRPKYSYTPYDTARTIKMSKYLTKNAIPQRIKESIFDVYDFINKMTAICLSDGYYVDVDNCMILNFGFHDLYSNENLYLVAEKCKKVKQNGEYLLYDKLYTKYEIYDLFTLEERRLPKQWRNDTTESVDLNVIRSTLRQDMRYMHRIPWHKLEVMRAVNNHNKALFNKLHLKFNITKPQFIASFIRAKKSRLIPIVVFIHGCQYRIEFLQIVRIKHNIDIGISYICSPRNGLQATAIHLNKDLILCQHQLATKHHDCKCLGDFSSIADDIHIGNPNDDKNRVKDLQNKSHRLRQQLKDQHDEIQQLKHENYQLKRENAEVLALQIQVHTLQDVLLQMTHMDSVRSFQPVTPLNSHSGTTPTSANLYQWTPLSQIPQSSVTPVAAFPQQHVSHVPAPIRTSFPQQPHLQSNMNNVAPQTGVTMAYAPYANTVNANRQFSLSNNPQSFTSVNNNNNNHNYGFTPHGTIAHNANIQQNVYSNAPVIHDHHHRHHKRNNK